jgi:hypothetical protein
MNSVIKIADNNSQMMAVPQTAIHNSGDNVTQIASNQGGIVNVYIPSAPGMLYNGATKINAEYYNLFVVGDETFSENFFLLDKRRALTISEDVDADISEHFAALTPEAQYAIKTFPSIFASKNHNYGRTDDAHSAVFGLVTDIRIQENGIKIYLQRLSAIPQQRLNEIAFRIAIKGNSSFNELDRTHWAIKRINLVEELRAAGISVLLPT